jgi:hypothetical protein
MHWIETIADPAQIGRTTEVSNKEILHQNDKQENEK